MIHNEKIKNISGHFRNQPSAAGRCARKNAGNNRILEAVKKRKDVEIIVSTLVFTVLYKCNEQKLHFLLDKLAQLDYEEVPITNSVRELANFYLENNVLKKKSTDDLMHIAAATLNGCRYIISWNFKHFVNPKTINAVNAINLTLNLPQIGIFSPTMMLGGF